MLYSMKKIKTKKNNEPLNLYKQGELYGAISIKDF